MNKGTCTICNQKADYGKLVCDDCLRTFDFEDHTDEVEYATYNAQDDRLRIYSGKVSESLYAVLTTIGYLRAPAQGCFYNAWSCTREDAALALCSDILDDDSSLEDRAADRALRFATYSDNAGKRARSASAAADEIASRFEFGQPILIGHHSAKRALRDKERINQNMRRACEEFDRRDYWKDRAANAEHHAAHMTAVGTVINRIKKLESELRKRQKSQAESEAALRAWGVENITAEQAHRAANFYSVSKCFPLSEYPRIEHTYEGMTSLYSALDFITPAQAQEIAVRVYLRSIERDGRWVEHYENQLTYWKTFLVEEHGSNIDDQYQYQKCQWVVMNMWNRPSWGQILRVNRSRETKRITTLTIGSAKGNRHYTDKWGYENIKAVFDHEPTLTEIAKALNIGESKPTAVYTPPQPDPEREALEAKTEQLEKMEVVVNHNPDFFPTPMPLVWRMVELADIQYHDNFLEPEAGDGRIAQYVWQHDPRPRNVLMCEINPAARKVLEGLNDLILDGTDFLEYNPPLKFTKILMNPPFSKEQDILHIRHAWDLLASKGRIVAIASEHCWIANNNRCTQFREWLNDLRAMVEELPEGTFKESGTMVRARLVVIDKPINIDTPVEWHESSVGEATQQELWAAFQ